MNLIQLDWVHIGTTEILINNLMEDCPIISQEEIDKKNNMLILLTNDDYLLIKEKFDIHTEKHDFFNHNQPVLSTGQHFLYEIVGSRNYYNDGTKYSLSYPKLGIYLNTYPCDQTIELEWADHRRTWEYKFRYNEHCFVGERQSVLRYLPLWSSSILIYGV